MTRFTIVIPLYDKAETITQAINSVVTQSFVDWELVVVDDGSRDHGAAIVAAQNDPRIKLITQVNAGVSAARNTGIAAAGAPYIAFLDADDYWHREHLANLGTLIASWPDATLYATAYNIVSSDDRVRRVQLRPSISERGILDDYFVDAVTIEPPIQTSAVAVPRAHLDEVGGFPVGIAAGEDMITWSRLACLGRIAYSTIATAYYRFDVGAAPRTPSRPDYVGAALAELSFRYPERAPSIERYLAYWHRLAALAYAETGQRLPSLGEILRAITRDGFRARDGVTALLNVMPARARSGVLARVRNNRHRRRMESARV
jgi:hypothetical protein